MLLELHKSLQRLLYERGNISSREVDITFEAPTRERIDKLTRPTINVFLFDLLENTDLRQNNFQTARGNGRAERRLAPRRFDLRYMVSALSTAIEDEHELLWRVLGTLVRYPQYPKELLPQDLQCLEPPLATRVGQADEGQRLSAIWTSLSVPPHPALYYVVTVPVDMNLVLEAPLVLTRTARYTRTHTDEVVQEMSNQIGGIVRSETGEPLANVKVAFEGKRAVESETNEEGCFVLGGVPSGTVRLHVMRADGRQKTVTVEVPESNQIEASADGKSVYDIVLEAATS